MGHRDHVRAADLRVSLREAFCASLSAQSTGVVRPSKSIAPQTEPGAAELHRRLLVKF